jgi:vancomycin resistance protein VanJ
MRKLLQKWWPGILWFYSALIVAWLVLNTVFGDELWLLALVNTMAPLLFLPVAPMLLLGLTRHRRQLLAPAMPVVVIFLSLYGEQFPLRYYVADLLDGPDVTVMSFNIWGGSRTADTAHVLADNYYPDIVAIQELTAHMAGLLEEMVGAEYPFRAIQQNGDYLGLGILSRFPLTELDASALSGLGWKVQIAQVDIDERPLVLYNLHAAATDLLGQQHAGIPLADEVRTSYQQRRAFAQRLNEDIARRDLPVVVAGDFNSTDRSDVYKILTRRLVDSYREAGWGFGHTFPVLSDSYREVPILARLLTADYAARQTTSSPFYRFASLGLMRIDMIFHNRGLETTRSWVSASHGESDHLPVLARLRWAE